MNTGAIRNLATSLLCSSAPQCQYFTVQVIKWQRWHPLADGIHGKQVYRSFLWQPWQLGLAASGAINMLSPDGSVQWRHLSAMTCLSETSWPQRGLPVPRTMAKSTKSKQKRCAAPMNK
jgi:hypothetical protein